MAYTPQYYPGQTINRKKHLAGNLEKLRDLPEAQVCLLPTDGGIYLKEAPPNRAARRAAKRGAKGPAYRANGCKASDPKPQPCRIFYLPERGSWLERKAAKEGRP